MANNTVVDYNNVECCEKTRKVDDLLTKYRLERIKTIDLLVTDPGALMERMWAPAGKGGLLMVDNNCLCRMGKGEIRSPFSCAQCKSIGRLMDFGVKQVGETFILECGLEGGRELIVREQTIGGLYLRWDPQADHRNKLYLSSYPAVASCGTETTDNTRCVVGDSFTTKILTSWIVERVMINKDIPHTLRMHTAFVCRNTGYTMSDYPRLGTIAHLQHHKQYLDSGELRSPKARRDVWYPLKSNVVRSIILQLVVALKELSSINFVHGAPSANVLLFRERDCDYTYEGLRVTSPITLKIGDYSNSSFTFNDIHVYPYSKKFDFYAKRTPYVPEIRTIRNVMSYCQLNESAPTSDVCRKTAFNIYRLKGDMINIFSYMRHSGIPIYAGSFDFYCFMVSLMCDKAFYNTVMNNQEIYRLWSMMWLLEDLPVIEERITQQHDILQQANRVKSPRKKLEVDVEDVDLSTYQSVKLSDEDLEERTDHRMSARALADFETVAKMLKGVWLRCDILDLIFDLAK